jgi:hypothetical protein
MSRNLPQTLVRAAVTAVTALMAFYLGGLTYRLVTQLAYYLAVMTLIIFHIFGIDSSMLQAIVHVAGRVRESQPAMYAAGAVAFGLVAWLAPRALRFEGSRVPRVLVTAGIPLVFAAGLVADYYYNVTPLSDLAFGAAAYNARNRPIERRWTVEAIAQGTGGVSGTFAETEGLLEYRPSMRRFVLRSLTENGLSINVYFFKGRRSPFSDVSADGKPRYYDAVQPYIGQKVKLLGTCWTGQIDVDIADVQRAAQPAVGG